MKDYQNLPDILTHEEVTAHFQEVLAASSAAPSLIEMVKALFELAQRQWHTYTPLDQGVRPKLENWVKANWEAAQADKQLNYFLSIIVTLKLDGCIALLEETLQSEHTASDVKARIQGALEEYSEPAEVY